MSEYIIRDIIIKGSSEFRKDCSLENCFFEKSKGFYQYVNQYGNKTDEFILINETEIKNDYAWMKEKNVQKKDKIDLELARTYQKVLEERYYKIIVEMETLANRIHYLSVAIRQEEKPEYNPSELDSEEEKANKADYRVVYHNLYRKLIVTDIAGKLKKNIEDINSYLYDEKLYVLNKKENYGKRFMEEFSNAVEEVVTEYWNLLETDEDRYMSAKKEQRKKDEKLIQKSARRKAEEAAYNQIFLYRTEKVENWIELLFLKFYQELDARKPFENRKEWLANETKVWFEIEEKSENVWKFTKEAVGKLTELEDEAKRLDLMNYRITPNVLFYEKIKEKILEYDIKKDYLESKAAVSEKGIIKKLNGKMKVMEPFTACVLWKECNVSFEQFFRITPVEIPKREEEFRRVCKEIIDKTEKLSDKVFTHSRYKKNFDENDFWYTPMLEFSPIEICINLSSLERVKIIITYGTFLMEPVVIELPYSKAMKKIMRLEDENIEKILKDTGYETKEELLQYCAEIMARNYCKIFLGIPYDEFQNRKRNKNL